MVNGISVLKVRKFKVIADYQKLMRPSYIEGALLLTQDVTTMTPTKPYIISYECALRESSTGKSTMSSMRPLKPLNE